MKNRQPKTEVQEVAIKPAERSVLWFVLGQQSPLIMNAFSQKAIEQMLKKHMGQHEQREAKKPRELIERAIVYNTAGKICMPPVAFMKSMLTVVATGAITKMNKPKLRGCMRVVGESIPIDFEKMSPRMDIVRNANKQPDVRFRPQFNGWNAKLGVQFDPNRIQPATIVDLLQRAGDGVGIGEWRPERDGTFGRFEVVESLSDSKVIGEAMSACAVPLRMPEIPAWALDAEIDLEALQRAMAPAGDGEPEDGKEDEEPTPPKKRAAGGR